METFSFPSPKTKDPNDHFVQRVFEILPGFLTWSILLGVPLLVFFVPVWVAIFIIAFDLYWIYKSFFVSLYTIGAYNRLRKGLNIQWDDLVLDLNDVETSLKKREDHIQEIQQKKKEFSSRKEFRRALQIQKQEYSLLKEVSEKDQRKFLPVQDIIQVVMFPTATEGPEIIRSAIQAVRESTFPNKQIIVLLATEENEERASREYKIRVLKEEFGEVFKEFFVTTHKVAQGEMKCKASNTTFAAKELQRYFDNQNIPYENVILSNFDCDTVCHPQYLSALAFFYSTEENRLQFAYQPLPMYNNNIWDTNAFVRVVVFNSTFWHMFQSTRSRMVTFSSHSEAFATLVRLNYWPVNMISEDSIIYWKGFSYYDGEYRTKIIPLPVSMDAALANTYWGYHS